MSNFCKEFSKICVGLLLGVSLCSIKSIYYHADMGTCLSDLIIKEAKVYQHENNISN